MPLTNQVNKKEFFETATNERLVLGNEKILEKEAAESVEAAPPQTTEAGPRPSEEATTAAKTVPLPTATPLPPPTKDPHLVEVEKMLSEGLEETYQNLPPQIQIKFRKQGEQIAQIIWQMIETARVQIKKITNLISNWLKLIPGINRLFLEQEAKIKADKIQIFAEKHKK